MHKQGLMARKTGDIMKKLVKSMLYMSMCAVLLGACTESEEDEKVPPSDGKAEMLSFGFYKADNAALDTDYVVETVSREMVIRLPEELFEDTKLKSSLVARFTLGEEDVAYVGGVEQVSGQTANDYNYPVDFTVTDSRDNTASSQYTVRVGKILDIEWKEVATITGENGAIDEDLIMAINPVDNQPYFFYTDDYDLDGTMRAKAVVSKWDGSKMVAVGNMGFSGRVYTVCDMKFDKEGTPYVFYSGYVGTSSSQPAVMKLSGSTWTEVGEVGYADRMSSSLLGAMGIDAATQQPFTVHTSGYANLTLPRYSANFSSFNGSTWNSNQPFSIAGDQRVANPKTLAVGDDIYMLYAMQNNVAGNADDLAKGYTLLKYSKGGWTKVVDNFCLEANQSHYGNISLAADSQGTIYCGFFDSSDSGWAMQLWKVEGSTFVKVANSINLNVDGYSKGLYSVGIDKNDVPYVICRNDADNSISIYKYDVETTQWGDPYVVSTNAGTDSPVQMAFNAEGVGYAVYISRDEATRAYTYHVLCGQLEADVLPE